MLDGSPTPTLQQVILILTRHPHLNAITTTLDRIVTRMTRMNTNSQGYCTVLYHTVVHTVGPVAKEQKKG